MPRRLIQLNINEKITELINIGQEKVQQIKFDADNN
jgi:hypothetical protein